MLVISRVTPLLGCPYGCTRALGVTPLLACPCGYTGALGVTGKTCFQFYSGNPAAPTPTLGVIFQLGLV